LPCTAFAAPRTSSAPSGIANEQAIDCYIQEEISAKNIPGIAVAVVEGQETVYLKGFGLASISKQTPVSTQTVFDLASCSKSFTALGVLTLWHDGVIDIDKPYVNYVPEFKMADADVSLRITIRELLLQTSGIPGVSTEPLGYYNGSGAMQQLVATMSVIHPDRTPGSSFEYTNLNYGLLGALVERVSGQPFEDYMRDCVFVPLGMFDTTLSPEVAAGENRADGHQLLLGKVVARNTPVFRSMAPAGWVMSSAADMSRWLIVNLNDGLIDGVQVIPREVIELMHTTGVLLNKDGQDAGYSMGWFTGTTPDGELCVWHGGDTTNFLAETILLPEEKTGIVMLVNGQTCRGAHDIALGIARLVRGKTLALPAAPWWASWKSIDNMAICGLVLSAILILGIVPYIWWQIKIIKRRKNSPDGIKTNKWRTRIWWGIVPVTPWAIFGILFGGAYVVVQMLFGFNLFRTIVRFGHFAPPGVIVAAVAFFLAIALWAIVISAILILRIVLAGQQRN
jgi:putative pyoverdin transport system ATP-binding/permease protein